MTKRIPNAIAAVDDEARGSLDDAELVAGIRAGDVAAFEAVFRAYWVQLYRFANRYLASPDESEEAVQIVFARIWRSRDDLTVRGPFAAYLYLATRNACRDRLKYAAASASRHALFADARPRTVERDDADFALRESEIAASIERSLAELPGKRRAICELRFRHDLSYAEIAARLGVSTKTVETQLARGVKLLRDRLRQLLD
jgi:RNA polymerase sigma-19 factor, ECF subfamily